MNISNKKSIVKEELPYEIRIRLLIKHNKELIERNENLMAEMQKNKITNDFLISENSRLNIENTLFKLPKDQIINLKRDQVITELRTHISHLKSKYKSLQKDHSDLIIKFLKATANNDPSRTN